MSERLTKWRLILGKKAEEKESTPLGQVQEGMDKVLEALYDSERKKGLGKSSPNVNRWLGDIRKYFPTPIVQLMQKDALTRLGLDQMLLEPELLESIQPDVELVGTILSLHKVMPEKTKQTARIVVQKVVRALEKKLRNPMREAIQGAFNRAVRNRRPRYNEIDWNKTIRANLHNYQESLQTIIPEHLRGYGKKGNALKHIILLADQSGSMATSVVYSGIFSAILASLKSVQTNIVVFDTNVVDLTDTLPDPVELLFGTQLGGGTDIHKALTYVNSLIRMPSDTILVLISDLYEGGNEQSMLRQAATLKQKGIQFITLLALNDKGAPMYDQNIAQQMSQLDIPVFACTPDQFPDLMAAAIKKERIQNWMAREGIVGK